MIDERAVRDAEAAAQAGWLEEAALALAGAGARPATQQIAQLWASARCQECQGDLAAALRSALQAASQASADTAISALSWLAAARLCLALGEPKRAQDHLGRAAALVPEDWALGQALLNVGHARLSIFLGRLEEAQELLAGAPLASALGAAELRLCEGLLQAASDRQRDAIVDFTAAADLALNLRLPYLRAAAFVWAVEAALGEGELQGAEDWLAEVRMTAEALGFQRLQGHAHRLRGQMLRARGDYAGAVGAFVEGLLTFVRLEDRLGVACTDLAFGAMLARDPGAGDTRRGLFLLEEARGIFQRAGAVLLAERAAWLLAGG